MWWKDFFGEWGKAFEKRRWWWYVIAILIYKIIENWLLNAIQFLIGAISEETLIMLKALLDIHPWIFMVLIWLPVIITAIILLIITWNDARKVKLSAAGLKSAASSEIQQGSESKDSNPTNMYTTLLSKFEQAFTDDMAKLKIFSRNYSWDLNGMRQTDASIKLTLSIINANIFPIIITGISGRFWIENQECAYPAEFEGLPRIPHGEYSNICIKQRLSKEMKDLIIGLRESAGMIIVNIEHCKIAIKPEIESANAINIAIGEALVIGKLEIPKID